MSDYKVGQILFIIPAGAANVVPVMIIERRIIETVEGTAIKHVVKGPKPKGKQWYLETIKGQVHSDIRTIRELMLSNATHAIDSMLKHASNVAQQAFEQKPVTKPIVQAQQAQVEAEIDPFEAASVIADNDENVEVQYNTQDYSFTDVQADAPTDDTIEVFSSNGQKQRVKLKAS